ncbi:MAG: WXG100 family type VII secretion target [Chloroflexi bacterium]|nr:WXG100 family type VII secretion target [Chloroflexota bacterium]
MTSPLVQVQYAELQKVSASFRHQQQEMNRLLRRIEDQTEVLRCDNWIGDNADRFYEVIEGELMPGMTRLGQALAQASEAMTVLIAIFVAAEEEASGIFNGEGAPGGSSGGGAGGGGVPGGGASGATPGTWTWGQSFTRERLFKFGGDVLTLAEPIAVALGLIPEPFVSKAGGLAVGLTLLFGGAALKYGEKYDEEPDLIRGGSIALTDSLLGVAIGLTGVGEIVQIAAAADQVNMAMETAQTHIQAEFMPNLSPDMRQDMHEMADRYYETAAATDITNLRYEAARLYYDTQHDWSALPQDIGRAFQTVGEFGVGLVYRPDHELDNAVAQSMGWLASAANTTGILPPDMSHAVTEFAEETTEFFNENDLVELPFRAAGRVVEWLF